MGRKVGFQDSPLIASPADVVFTAQRSSSFASNHHQENQSSARDRRSVGASPIWLSLRSISKSLIVIVLVQATVRTWLLLAVRWITWSALAIRRLILTLKPLAIPLRGDCPPMPETLARGR